MSYVTYALLAANALVFGVVTFGPEADLFMIRWAVMPHSLVAWLSDGGSPAALITPLTALFVHAGWVHLVSNMVYLWFFGTKVEVALGSGRFLGLYLLAGVSATITQALAMLGSDQPIVGSSGAVAGLLGAFLALYPWTALGVFRERKLAPRVGNGGEVSALLMFGLWILGQAFSGVSSMVGAQGLPGSTMTWWAHLTGLAVGAGLVGWLRTSRSLRA